MQISANFCDSTTGTSDKITANSLQRARFTRSEAHSANVSPEATTSVETHGLNWPKYPADGLQDAAEADFQPPKELVPPAQQYNRAQRKH